MSSTYNNRRKLRAMYDAALVKSASHTGAQLVHRKLTRDLLD